MTTFGSLFSGFGGADIGAKAAGLELAWGVELEPAIAEVANANMGGHVQVMDILDADPHRFDRVDVLHASPPCPNFSVAKATRGETALDIALARKVAEFIAVLRPQVFTLENVYAYRRSKSWAIIEGALHAAGYWMNLAHVNSADFGVPQTRRRMIVRAVLGGSVPYLPPAEPWIGWYQAIEDLIPTLPESKFAKWQLDRLPETMQTLQTFIVPGGNANSFDVRYQDEPARTVESVNRVGNMPRAFLVDGKLNDKSQSITVRNGDDPAFTVTTSHNNRDVKAWLSSGRVVKMTTRALARFQSIPDWYELPDNNALALKGIGNAVPSLMYQKIIRQMAFALSTATR